MPLAIKGDSDSNGTTSPSLEGRYGRPILLSLLPCWQKDVDKYEEALGTAIMGILFMILLAVFAEAVRYFRESLETSAVLVIARNKIDVKTREINSPLECDAEEKDCVRVVEEVVTPLRLKRCHWRHLTNTALYGIQCGLQLQCLLGVLSLNIPLILSVLMGVLLGRLLFYWRPRRETRVLTPLTKRL